MPVSATIPTTVTFKLSRLACYASIKPNAIDAQIWTSFASLCHHHISRRVFPVIVAGKSARLLRYQLTLKSCNLLRLTEVKVIQQHKTRQIIRSGCNWKSILSNQCQSPNRSEEYSKSHCKSGFGCQGTLCLYRRALAVPGIPQVDQMHKPPSATREIAASVTL